MPSAPARTVRPMLEKLEDRTVPSAVSAAKEVPVMSQNLYLGPDLEPVVAALSTGEPNLFIPAISQAWATVRANDFFQRAEALADEIAEARPYLVGLQEAVVWRTGPADPQQAADFVEYDYIDILMDE